MMLLRHANAPRFLDSFPSSFAPVRVAHALCDCPGLINGGLRPPPLCVCLTFCANFPFRPCLFLPSVPIVADDQDESHSIFPSPRSSFSTSVRAIALTSPLSVSSTIVSPSLPPTERAPAHSRTHAYTLRERPNARACGCGASEAAGGGAEASARCAVSSSAVRGWHQSWGPHFTWVAIAFQIKGQRGAKCNLKE